ncbi:hypothetical protein P0Y35_18070 [Kiritimatiellaeota bacterium B1221]|nr:hypothetical protein [Kiritimatiellaeota bacterium B1221]
MKFDNMISRGPKKLFAFTTAFTLIVGMNACAPTQPAPEPEATQAPQRIEPVHVDHTPAATRVPPAETASQRPVFDPKNPNWELRYHELYEKFSAQFTPPTPGQKVQIELRNGAKKDGILKNLTATELSLELGNGEMTLAMDSLSESSAAHFFESAYAREKALDQGRREYQHWEKMQASASSAPAQTVQETTGGTSGNPAASPGQNGVDVPDTTSTVGSAPKNEGPTGRVKQVDAYIRKNAALPDSLQVKAWGPVQKNGNGYKVRVQYSLESAGGFGRSHEDMMFFMYASGRVYRKAAVK